MFNVEDAIAKWRQQMLAAGIKSPVPLEELESHLREEIEQQMKFGLSEAEALKVGVQKIGETHRVQREFNKIEGHKMWRSIMLTIGWLAAGYTLLLLGIANLDFNWNFFSFHPKWDVRTLVAFIVIPVAEAGIWFLAKSSRNIASRIVSLLVCLFLAGIGTYNFFRVQTGILGGVREVPAWYRDGLLLLLCLPGVFWIWWERRRVIQERSSTHESQYV